MCGIVHACVCRLYKLSHQQVDDVDDVPLYYRIVEYIILGGVGIYIPGEWRLCIIRNNKVSL